MTESPDRKSEDSFRSARSTLEAPPRFSPKEEAALLQESNDHKIRANQLYASAAFDEAIGTYDQALASCPTYLDYEVAVLKSNIAACHLRLADWKAAITAASVALDGLERVVPTRKKKTKEGGAKDKDAAASKADATTTEILSKPPAPSTDATADATVIELDSDDDAAEATLAALAISDARRAQVRSLRTKSLMRRARANGALGGWAALAAAESDLREVLKLDREGGGLLPAADRRFVQQQLAELPGRIGRAKEEEMAEMMGKLKELGNGILKPFGLSTDMFNFQQDPKSGGYNMSFGGNSNGS